MRSTKPLHIFVSHPSHFLTDCEPHGDGLLAFQYIRRLAGRGHQLHVAVPLMKLQKPLPPNVYLHPVRSMTRPSSVNPPALNRVEYALRVRALFHRIRKHAPIDLIHQLNPVVPGMSLFLGTSGVPIVLGPLPPSTPLQWDATQVSNVGTPTMAHRLRDLVLRRQIKDASLVLIPTEKSLDQVPDHPSLRHKVRLLNYGVDTAQFAPGPQPLPMRPSVLFLSNLLRRKGAFLLLEAFEKTAPDLPDCVLRFAGTGPDEAALRTRASQSALASRIEFMGSIPYSKVADVINACTVFCLPSYCEPFGMAALEAMSCGKPVIGCDSGGLGLLLDDEGARRVTPGDAGHLAKALAELLASSSLREKMGRHNRQRVLDHFSWDKVIDDLEQHYQEVVATHARLDSYMRTRLPLQRRRAV